MTAQLERRLSESVGVFSAALDHHAGALRALRDTIRREAEQTRRAGRSQLAAALASLPLPAVASWSDASVWAGGPSPRWVTTGTLAPIAVRFGELRSLVSGLALPTVAGLVEILGAGHVAIVEAGGGPDLGSIQGIVLRTLTAAAAGSAESWFIDARGAGSLSAPFAPLLNVRQRAAEAVAINERSIEDLLTRLSNHILDVQSNILQGRHSTLAEFYAQSSRATVPRRLLVVNGFPRGFNQDSVRTLETIVRSGAASGIHVLMTVDESVSMPHDASKESILASTNTLRPAGGDLWAVSAIPGCGIRFDSGPPRDLVLSTVGVLAATAVASSSATFPLDATLPAAAEFWRASSEDGLATCLGYDAKGDAVAWEVSDRGSLWSTFIAGTAGSGKSNLLHVIIAGLAARYAPTELEMYLLDFKQGVEMWQYGPATSADWLPHVKLVARATDRELGIDVLVRLKRELDSRYMEFSNCGLPENTYSSFRHQGGRRPRTLVVLDEFQDLLLPADQVGDRAIDLLGQLAKLGRAGGFHLILATQTLNGLSEVQNKLKGILDQHQLRIALRLDPDMSLEVAGRREAATLKPKGQAIFQRGMGSPDFDQVDVLYAEGATLDRVRSVNARRRRSTALPPFAYDGTARPTFDELGVIDPVFGSSIAAGGMLAPIIGRPVAMAASHAIGLRPDPGNHLVIGGDGRDEAEGVLQAAALSIAAQSSPGTVQFLLIDPVPGRSALIEVLKTGLVALGQSVAHVKDGPLLTRQLQRLGRIPPSGRPLQRVILVGADMNAWSFLGVDGELLADALAPGPLRGVHAMLWFPTLSGPEMVLGFRFLADHAHHRVLLGASRDEQLTSGFLPSVVAERPAGRSRIDLWSRDQAAVVQRLIPPVALERAELAAWLARRGVAGVRAAGRAS